MFLDLPSSDLSLSYQMSLALTAFNRADPMAFALERAELMMPGVTGHTYIPPTDNCVGQIVIVWNGYALLLHQGASSPVQGSRLENGWRQAINYSVLGGANPYLVNMAITLSNQANLVEAMSKPRIVVAGHSLGGAASEVLTLRQTSLGVTFGMSCVTYGSPKPGPDTFSSACDGLDICRWMNDDDPVPFIPPHQTQAPLYFALLDNVGRLNCNRYCQTRGGVNLFVHGDVSTRDLPSHDLENVQLNIGAWLVSLALGTSSPHAMGEYNARLFDRRGLSLGNPPPVRPTTHSGKPEEASTRENARAADEALNALNLLIREGNNTPTVIPRQAAFTYQKVGLVWCTFLHGDQIAVGPTRRRASRLANLGNQFVKRLQTEGIVHTNALSYALSEYLRQATNPDGDFKPVMRTDAIE